MKTCKTCGVVVTKRRRSKNCFCSLLCASKGRVNTSIDDKITICKNCNSEIITKININKPNKYIKSFCSRKCSNEFNSKLRELEPLLLNCAFCSSLIERKNHQTHKNSSGRNFCNKSCASKFNRGNSNLKLVKNRSKLELQIESILDNMFPKLEILYNDRNTIRLELDIYLPSLKLAIELNGPHHYLPLYGEDKLVIRKQLDEEKIQSCTDIGIELYIINTSIKLDSQQYINQVISIINAKLN